MKDRQAVKEKGQTSVIMNIVKQLETGIGMHDDYLPANLQKRIEELKGREASYWEDELYSVEALTNGQYREELEKCFRLDPLGPLPPQI